MMKLTVKNTTDKTLKFRWFSVKPFEEIVVDRNKTVGDATFRQALHRRWVVTQTTASVKFAKSKTFETNKAKAMHKEELLKQNSSEKIEKPIEEKVEKTAEEKVEKAEKPVEEKTDKPEKTEKKQPKKSSKKSNKSK